MRIRWVLLALVIGVVVWLVSAGPGSRSRDEQAIWSDAVAGVARDVEHIRGLEFEHRVPVTFLDDQDLTAAFRERFEVSQRRASSIAGYYDPRRDEVYVTGDERDPASLVILAHELTHALQEQHHDIPRLAKRLDTYGSWDVLTYLQEGDAMLVFDEYTTRLERAREITPLDHASPGVGPSDRAAPIRVVHESSPYVLAPSALRVYRAAGGTHHSVDVLYEHPPRSTDAFLTPSKLFAPVSDDFAPAPPIDPGERFVGGYYRFDALSTYLLLAEHLEPEDALRIADGWADAGSITIRRGDERCTRITFVGISETADAAFADGFARWAATGDDPDAVDTDPAVYGTVTTVTRCGDRKERRARVEEPLHLLMVAATRNHMTAQLVREFDAADAECAANSAMDEPFFEDLVRQAERVPWRLPSGLVRTDVRRRLSDLARVCAADGAALLTPT